VRQRDEATEQIFPLMLSLMLSFLKSGNPE